VTTLFSGTMVGEGSLVADINVDVGIGADEATSTIEAVIKPARSV